jgi:thioredoxin-related protein
MKKTFFFLMALSLLGTTTGAAEKPAADGALPGQWTMDFDAALNVAAAKKLPLLLNFTGSDWCGWCKLMDKSVFSQEAWQTYAKANLMLVWIDFPNDKSLVPEKYVARNKALSERFAVQGYPSYIILDDDGKRLLGQLGADRESTPEIFIAKLKELFQDRAAEVDALLASMPEKSAQDFRSSVQKRDTARAELKALETAYEKRSAELTKLIAEQEKHLKTLREQAQMAKLPPATAASYQAKKTRHEALTAEIDAWIATEPPKNEENQKKYSAWRSELASLEKEMRQLLIK